MSKIVLIFSIIFVTLGSASDVVPHDQDYYTAKIRNIELIYTEKNLPFANQAAAVEMRLQPLYEAQFGYEMDELLHVGLISDYNQIANGFSTPYPNNRQINFIGGAIKVDYFSSTSWLNVLLYHETAHNYQINAKANSISSTLYRFLGNGSFLVPWFTLPNITESSFLLEGNAVLNESWHGNGGRLYSGRFKAATLMQAKAGYLTVERVYNNNYYFLYGSHHYTLGGFYEYYLAKRYGLKNVNAYWQEHSKDWYWPFFTNNSMERSIGVDFETSLTQWREQMQADALHVNLPQGEVIATSQFFEPLNSDEKEIYFIVNESGRQTPELVRLSKFFLHVNRKSDSYRAGKVLHVDNDYVTQAGAMTSPLRIYQGLYDSDGFILKGSESKVMQGYLSDGTAVYFDVASSFDQPQLYVGSEFYAQVNSSVFIDTNDNLYYFVQEGKKRTLYKNRTPLLTLLSYYSIVSDIDSKGAIYFIANSEYGSALYRFNGNKIERMSGSDTIIDARLIDDANALVAAVGSDAYYYEKIVLEPSEEQPFEEKLYFESMPEFQNNYDAQHVSVPPLDLNNSYNSLLSMSYSGANIFLGSDVDAGLLFNVSFNFADPLLQNAFSIFSWRDTNAITVAGAKYENSLYLLEYSLLAYGVIEESDRVQSRNSGIMAQARLPFLKKGYYSGSVSASYYEDYETLTRTPMSIYLNLLRQEHYGVSMFNNFLAYASLYVCDDRDDVSYGGEIKYEDELFGENYIGLQVKYSKSDTNTPMNLRGIKLTDSAFETINDPSTIVMPSLKNTLYLKGAGVARATLRTVFNASAYYFTFPISLRREALELEYSYYDLEGFGASAEVNELKIALTLDTLWLNKLTVPIKLSYIYNDNEEIAEKHSALVTLGIAF